jgi:hypothetical protein
MPLNNNTPKVRNNPQNPENKDEAIKAAHDQAEHDIEEDGELDMKPSPMDDLDEGETARYGDEANKENDEPRQ